MYRCRHWPLIECKLTPATRSPEICSMDYPCGKFGDCSFSHFGSILQMCAHTQTDVHERFTPTFVAMSKDCVFKSVYKSLRLLAIWTCPGNVLGSAVVE